MRAVLTPLVLAGLLLAAAGCGDDSGDDVEDGSLPRVVVTTSILGDIVREVAGDLADVEVVMPNGADPHEFAPSARQAEAMVDADLLVVNGADFEQGLLGQIEQAEAAGTPVFAAADHVELLALEDGSDPHFWLDADRMAEVVAALGERVSEVVDGADAGRVQEQADAYTGDLRALDAEIEALVSAIPTGRRVLVTNHEVLGYFADRYGFEVVGAVVPSLTTGAQPSTSDVEELADLVEREGVPAIFAETTSSTRLAETLADRVGAVEVVQLHTESLGEPGSGAETYLGLLRTDARLVADALS